MSVFLIIVCALLFVFFLLEAFVFGDRYAKWWFNQFSKDYKEYDLKKFRFIRGVALGLVFILSFLTGFGDFKNLWIYMLAMIAVVISHYCIILHHCRKS